MATVTVPSDEQSHILDSSIYTVSIWVGRVPHGYGNTRGVSKTGNTGSGTVLDFATPRIPCTRTAVLWVFHG